MFRLRDLIFSQSQSQSQSDPVNTDRPASQGSISTAVSVPPSIPSASAAWGSESSSSSSSDEENPDDDNADVLARNKRRRLAGAQRRLGQHYIAPVKSGLSQIFEPEPELPELAEKRAMVRALWHDCYYCKDFEGALQVLDTLVEIENLTLHEVSKYVDILKHKSDGKKLILHLAQSLLVSKLYKSSMGLRRGALAIFLEALVSLGDFAAAKLIFQNRVSDPAFIECPKLVALQVSILCLQLIELCKDIGNASFTESSEFVHLFNNFELFYRNPMYFVRAVAFASETGSHLETYYRGYQSSSNGNNLRTCSTNRIRQLQQSSQGILNEFKQVFNLALPLHMDLSTSSIDFHLLYLSYLEGLNQKKKAIEYVISIQTRVVRELRNSPKYISCYYQLLIEYFQNMQLKNRLEIEIKDWKLHSIFSKYYLISCKKFVFSAKPSEQTVSMAIYLFELKVITWLELLNVIMNAIEANAPKSIFPNRLEDEVDAKTLLQFNTSHPGSIGNFDLFLWVYLVSQLGNVGQSVKVDDPIPEESDILPFICNYESDPFEILSKFQNGKNSNSYFQISRKGPKADGVIYEFDIQETPRKRHDADELFEERFWWRDVLLCPMVLGDFPPIDLDWSDLKTILDENSIACSKLADFVHGFSFSNIPFNEEEIKSVFDGELPIPSETEANSDDFISAGAIDEEIVVDKERRKESLSSEKFPSPLDTRNYTFLLELLKLSNFDQEKRSAAEYLSTRIAEVIDPCVLGDYDVKQVKLRSISPTKKNFSRCDTYSDSAFLLGPRLLIILTCQVIINSHMFGVDSLFTARATQIIMIHLFYEPTKLSAANCLNLLSSMGISLQRQINLASLISKNMESISVTPSKQHSHSDWKSENTMEYTGNPLGTTYRPV